MAHGSLSLEQTRAVERAPARVPLSSLTCDSLALHPALRFVSLSAGIANYRDQIHERFFKRLQARNVLQFTVCAFLIPAAFYGLSSFTISAKKQRYEDQMKAYKMPQVRKDTLQVQEE